MSSRVHVQRLLVIQDESIEHTVNAIRWAIGGLCLQPGDKIKLLRAVQLFNTSSSITCGLLGKGIKLHSSRTITQRQESFRKEASKSLDDDGSSDEIKNILQLARMHQIGLQRAVEAGHLLKAVIVQAAKSFDATAIILDRKSKKDHKYILEKLNCVILKMKSDRSVVYIRRRDSGENDEVPTDRGQSSGHLMIEPGEMLYQNSSCSICMNRRPNVGPLREFTYSYLQQSTSGFSSQNLLHNKRKVFFKGVLCDGSRIVVRKHALESTSEMEFKSRVQMLGKARHENVVMLLGSCSEGPERLLVYEYVCNNSLGAHLTNGSRELTWVRRMKITKDIVRGLQYLHTKSFYGSMRPNNILLTHDYNALLANFGLARNQYEDLNQFSESRVLKTFEYLAPEYEETGIDSSQADIYSLGVVLLELITGRKTIEETSGKSFLRWARPLLSKKSYGELIDPLVLESHDIHQLFWMVRVAERCLNPDPNKRYTIDKVVEVMAYISPSCDDERGLSLSEYEMEPAML